VNYREPVRLNNRVTVRFHDAGHILGSSMLEILVTQEHPQRRLIFSGDIGQKNKPLIRDPSEFQQADYLVMESTYGDKDHPPPESMLDKLALIINQTVERGGNLVIPTFAIERAQEIIFHLGRLEDQRLTPPLTVFLDSPMAIEATKIFMRYKDYLDEHAQALFNVGRHPFDMPGLKLVGSTRESKSINHIRGTSVILAGSGMCTGGRIKHHLASNISRPESTILFQGYQAADTLGRQIADGNPQVRIFGQLLPVKARIEKIDGLSAHADRQGLLDWVSHFSTPPQSIFLTHGEENAMQSLAQQLRRTTQTAVHTPDYLEKALLL
jgi:metallo-beta-lactamase family protein